MLAYVRIAVGLPIALHLVVQRVSGLGAPRRQEQWTAVLSEVARRRTVGVISVVVVDAFTEFLQFLHVVERRAVGGGQLSVVCVVVFLEFIGLARKQVLAVESLVVIRVE